MIIPENEHIIILQVTDGIFINVTKKGSDIILTNKQNRIINAIDETIYKQYSDFSINYTLLPNNSKFVFQLTQNSIYLVKYRVNKTWINNTKDLLKFSKQLGVKTNKILFEGNSKNLTNKIKEKVFKTKNTYLITRDKKIPIVKNEFQKNQVADIFLTEIIDLVYENNLPYRLENVKPDLRYIELIERIFYDCLKCFNNFELKNNFNGDISYKYINDDLKAILIEDDNKRNLFRLLLTVFYKKKNHWSGYFYDQIFIERYQHILERIYIKINTNINLGSYLND